MFHNSERFFPVILTCEINIYRPGYCTCCMYIFLCHMCISVSHPIDQSAKGVPASYDALVEFLESIEHFFSRLNIYTRVTPTPAMDEVMVKIMVELFSTFALATKELKQGRSSESILIDMLRYSAQYSQIYKERIRREGIRRSPRETRSTHAR